MEVEQRAPEAVMMDHRQTKPKEQDKHGGACPQTLDIRILLGKKLLDKYPGGVVVRLDVDDDASLHRVTSLRDMERVPPRVALRPRR
jgi:hypothetical protein